jgi:hypothetical protein
MVTMVEWWYNTNHHSSTGLTPFEAVYGFVPTKLLSYVLGITANDAVDKSLNSREQIIQILRDNLLKSQNQMKLYADRLIIERSFVEVDLVFLILQPYY